jgi:hypothetical protein
MRTKYGPIYDTGPDGHDARRPDQSTGLKPVQLVLNNPLTKSIRGV